MFLFHVVTERSIISIVRIFIYRRHCFGGFFTPGASSCCFDIIVIHSKQGNILQDANHIKAATVMPSANSLFATAYTEADYIPIPTFYSPIPSELTNMEEANALILFRNANHVVFLRHSKHKQQTRHDAVDPFSPIYFTSASSLIASRAVAKVNSNNKYAYSNQNDMLNRQSCTGLQCVKIW